MAPLQHLSRTTLVAVFLTLGVVRAADAGAPLPIEELFRPALFGHAQLSPDGRHVGAIVSGDDDLRGLLILGFDGDKPQALRGERDMDLASFVWLDSDHVIFEVARSKLFSHSILVADRTKLHRAHRLPAQFLLRVISAPRRRPGHVLAETARGDQGIVELDVTRHYPEFGEPPSMAFTRMYNLPKQWDRIIGLRADFDGELALCFTYRGERATVHRYDLDDGTWQDLPIDIDQLVPLAVDPDGQHLWIVDYDAAEGYRLRPYEFATGTLGDAVARDPTFDLGEAHLYFSHKTRQLVGLAYTQRRLKNVWFKEPFVTTQQAMDQRYPDLDNRLVDFDEAETRFLYRSSSDREPGIYTLLDLTAKTSQRVTRMAPWLENQTFAATQPISFKASDGVRLEGYLTLPPGTSQAQPKPLVVLIHGGPAARDERAFDREVQFLASRGYAVLQPNYRGSSGYAPAISRLKRYDFRRMHDDITDATRAMLKTGLIDPSRVALMGGSFGGYLAISGVAFAPDLYRCAISNCGVFDWGAMIRSDRRSTNSASYEHLTQRFGDPAKDRAAFEAISPLAHVDAIRAPVLIAHGTDDHVVDVSQSRALAAALKKRGVPHATFFRALEGHGFYNYENRVEFYHVVERFLAQYLAPSASRAARP